MFIEQVLRFAFKASNNQEEYEALIVGMLLSKEMGVKGLLAKSDSLLVVSYLGNRHSGAFPFSIVADEVHRGCHRILHKVDRG